MAGLDSLLPEYRAQYESLLPEIKRKAREAANARGMFYSGDSTDAEVRAEEDLLAKLAAESARSRLTQSEGSLQRSADKDALAAADKRSKRAELMGLLGTGAGAATTLGGLAYMNPGNAKQIVPLGNGGFGLFDPKTNTITPTSVSGTAKVGVGGGALSGLPGAGGVAPDPVSMAFDGLPAAPSGAVAPGTPGPWSGPHTVGSFDVSRGGTGVGPAAGPAAGSPAAPGNSMWSKAGAEAAGAGALGGFAGDVMARKIGGGGGKGTDIGAGLGGGLGALAAWQYSGGNPWLAGLGALGGSLGGGLIGNLFK